MPRLEPSDGCRERVIAGPEHCPDGQAMRFEELTQPLVREHLHVLPRLGADPLVPVEREPVAESAAARRDVAERKRLPPEHERTDVVPTGEVLRRRDSNSAGPEKAPHLRDEHIRVGEVLDHLIRDDDIEHAGRERQGEVQVGLDYADPTATRRIGGIAAELDSVNLACSRRGCELKRARPVVASEVQKAPSRRNGVQSPLHVCEIQGHCPFEHPSRPACECPVAHHDSVAPIAVRPGPQCMRTASIVEAAREGPCEGAPALV